MTFQSYPHLPLFNYRKPHFYYFAITCKQWTTEFVLYFTYFIVSDDPEKL